MPMPVSISPVEEDVVLSPPHERKPLHKAISSTDAKSIVTPIWTPPKGAELDAELARTWKQVERAMYDDAKETAEVIASIGSDGADIYDSEYGAALCHLLPFAYTSQVVTDGELRSTQVDHEGKSIPLVLKKRADQFMFQPVYELPKPVARRWPARKEVDLYDLPETQQYERYLQDTELHLRLIERSERVRKLDPDVNKGKVHRRYTAIGAPQTIVHDLPPSRQGARPIGATQVDNPRGVCMAWYTHHENPEAWEKLKESCKRKTARSRRSRKKYGQPKYTHYPHNQMPIYRQPPSVMWFLKNPSGKSYFHDDTEAWPNGIVQSEVDWELEHGIAKLKQRAIEQRNATIEAATLRYVQGEGDVPGGWTDAYKVLCARMKSADRVYSNITEHTIPAVMKDKSLLDSALNGYTPIQNSSERAQPALEDGPRTEPFVGVERGKAMIPLSCVHPGFGPPEEKVGDKASSVGLDTRAAGLLAGNDSQHHGHIDATRLGGVPRHDRPAANDASNADGEVITAVEWAPHIEFDSNDPAVFDHLDDTILFMEEKIAKLEEATLHMHDQVLMLRKFRTYCKIKQGKREGAEQWQAYPHPIWSPPPDRIYDPNDSGMYDNTIEDSEQRLEETMREVDLYLLKNQIKKRIEVLGMTKGEIKRKLNYLSVNESIRKKELKRRRVKEHALKAMQFLSVVEKWAPFIAGKDKAVAWRDDRDWYRKLCAAAARGMVKSDPLPPFRMSDVRFPMFCPDKPALPAVRKLVEPEPEPTPPPTMWQRMKAWLEVPQPVSVDWDQVRLEFGLEDPFEPVNQYVPNAKTSISTLFCKEKEIKGRMRLEQAMNYFRLTEEEEAARERDDLDEEFRALNSGVIVPNPVTNVVKAMSMVDSATQLLMRSGMLTPQEARFHARRIKHSLNEESAKLVA